ncbi:hypothetical protein PF010_g27753 [Phytophthora fragariae]|nr:hypothetical protein PF003_g6628 [Phytophthora fragariae]KAE8920966.1 hypothetical protein PF009_g28747 [Phytophthora fragariae]KAE8968830.1 hypothetical protein PF011_g27039 [Phytophthora fragariae]KAE9066519.1 hypothetical protein PF007_g28423 [Phytophthora fragariae]KAE9066719.1 hypothetical protein PF010_g27753 [Phytophthora fragariae]
MCTFKRSASLRSSIQDRRPSSRGSSFPLRHRLIVHLSTTASSMSVPSGAAAPVPLQPAPVQLQAPVQLLQNFVRVYEERLLVDIAANLYREFARGGGIQREDIGKLLSHFPPKVVEGVFARYDQAGRGVVDARAFLALVRYLNFGNGFCDACFAPIGEHERGFMCLECRAGGYILCARCYPRGVSGEVHPSSHRFVPAQEMLEMLAPPPEDRDQLPNGVGVFLRTHIATLFAQMDTDRDGRISQSEFRAFQRAQGCADSFMDFLLSFAGSPDGMISKKELLYLVTGQKMTRQCDECGALKFVGQDQILSCLQCVSEDYDVCIFCWQSGRCQHEHANFRMSEPFQLRFAGLHYRYSHDDLWLLSVGSYELWAPYEPFLGDRLRVYARLGPPQPCGHFMLPKFTQPQSAAFFERHYGAAAVANNAANSGQLQQQTNNGDAFPTGLDIFSEQIPDFTQDTTPAPQQPFDWAGATGEVLSWFY